MARTVNGNNENQELQSFSEARNSILGFKPKQEEELAGGIREENESINRITDYSLKAKDYLRARDQIIRFKHERYDRDPLEPSNISTFLSRTHESKREVIQHALEIVNNKLCSQASSIFLYSKNGVLERAGIFGIDKDGKQIHQDWFLHETYRAGEGLPGRAAQPKDDFYGEIQSYLHLSKEDLTEESAREYKNKLGELRCAISIPLNGRNKTYGVLQVVNKIDSEKQLFPSDALFSKEDFVWLSFLAASVASALSNFRTAIQGKILQYLGRLLIKPSHRNVYQEVISLLVNNPETSFKAGILRVLDDDSNLLKMKGKASVDGIDELRKDRDVVVGQGLAGVVAESQSRLILQGINGDKEIVKFENQEWIRNNNFEAFGCFPICIKGEILGTLSLYTGYNYDFYPGSINFVQSVVDLLASFIYELKLEKIESETKRVIENSTTQFEQRVSSANIFAEKRGNDCLSYASQEIGFLSELEKHSLTVREIACIQELSVNDARIVLERLLREGYIDTVGNSILHYVFYFLGQRRRRKIVISDSETLFSLTSKGYYRLHPFISFTWSARI